MLSKNANLRKIRAKGKMNLRDPDTERTLGEGLFAFKLDHRALLIVRGDARDKVDDQRTTCLYPCNYSTLMSFSLFVTAAEAWISLSAAVRIIVWRSKTFDYLIGRHAKTHYLIFLGTGRRERRTRKFPRRVTGKFVVILGMCECADLCPTPSLSYRVSSVL